MGSTKACAILKTQWHRYLRVKCYPYLAWHHGEKQKEALWDVDTFFYESVDLVSYVYLNNSTQRLCRSVQNVVKE